MNLNAIKTGQKSTTQRAAEDSAQRNRSAGHRNLLFRDTAPVVAAVAKALATAPVKPVAPGAATTGDLVSALKALVAPITASIEKATASIEAPVAAPKMAPAVPAAPVQVSRSGNPPSIPLMNETQHRRAADAREEARKAAVRAQADHVLVTKGGSRVVTFRALNARLSDAALLALNHIVSKWEANDRRPIRIYASDLHSALDISLAAAQAAFTELVKKHLIISTKNSAGILLVMPGLGVTGV